MRSNRFTYACTTLLLSLSGYAMAQSAPAHPAHEFASVSTPAAAIGFGKTGIRTPAGELEAGPAYGNLAAGHHGTFIRMPAGFVSAPHIHTEDYYAVVVKGIGANDPVGAKPKPLGVGSYWFQRGEEAHVTRCLSKTGCLFFIVQPGKFDYVPAK